MRLEYMKYWIACGFTFVVLVIILSLSPEAPDIGHVLDIKVNHLIAYCWLMFWFAQIVRSIPARLGIAAALCVLGIAMEFAQEATGYRTFRVSDMWTDGLGVTLGFILSLGPMSGGLRMLEQEVLKKKA